MEVTIPVEAAKEIVTGLGKIVGRKCFIPYVWIQPQKEGVRVYGTNYEERACYLCPEATANGNDGFPINLADLRASLSQIRGDTLSITVNASSLDVKFVEDLWSATVTLDKIAATDCPVKCSDFLEAEWDMMEFPEFRSRYQFALPFASTDRTRWILNGVCFHKDGAVVATDGRRLVVHPKGHPFNLKVRAGDPPSMVVPDRGFLKWTGAGKIVGLQPTENRDLRIKTDRGWLYIVRTIDGTFPNYQQVIPSETPEGYFEFEDDAIRAFRFIQGLMLNSHDNCVRIEPLKTKVKIVLSAQNHKEGRKVKVDMNGCGNGTLKAATGVSVHSFIQALQRGFRKFHQADNLSPSVSFHAGWTHVLMPMRVNE